MADLKVLPNLQALELTNEQVSFIEKQNPAFGERHVESSRPRELLCQDAFFISYLKGAGKVYLHAIVDAYSGYGFGFPHASKRPLGLSGSGWIELHLIHAAESRHPLARCRAQLSTLLAEGPHQQVPSVDSSPPTECRSQDLAR